MTCDGVDGTAADCQPRAGPFDRAPGQRFIKRDDGLLSPRYIEPTYPHTPAGAARNSRRRERQVASALRNSTDLLIANVICGAAGSARRAGADPRLRRRRAAIGAAAIGAAAIGAAAIGAADAERMKRHFAGMISSRVCVSAP